MLDDYGRLFTPNPDRSHLPPVVRTEGGSQGGPFVNLPYMSGRTCVMDALTRGEPREQRSRNDRDPDRPVDRRGPREPCGARERERLPDGQVDHEDHLQSAWAKTAPNRATARASAPASSGSQRPPRSPGPLAP